jgi:phospholipid/cholesterol/gamma-HCH transport system substrate-binding protein
MNRFLDEENAERIKRSLANLELATGAIAPMAEDSRKALANIQAMSERLDRVSAEMAVEVSEGTLPRINNLVDQLTEDSRDLKRVLLQLERDPQSLLFGKTPTSPGPGEPGFSGGRR